MNKEDYNAFKDSQNFKLPDLEQKPDFEATLKPKPKINLKKLVKDQEIELTQFDIKGKVRCKIEDVGVEAEINVDLLKEGNYGLPDIKSAEISFTKKI